MPSSGHNIFLTAAGLVSDLSGYARLWDQFFPKHSPVEIYHNLKHGLPAYDQESIRIEFLRPMYKSHCTTLLIHADFFSNGTLQSEFMLEINIPNSSRINNAEVHTNKRSGTATQMLYNFYNICSQTNSMLIEVITKDIGSYMWLLYGFLPEGPPKENDNLMNNFAAIKDQLQPATLKLLSGLLESDSKYAWPLIAEIPDEVTALNPVTGNVERMPAGMAITLDSAWDGELDFNDEKSMARFTKQMSRKLEREI